MQKKGFSYGCYRVIRWLVWLFYPKTKVVGGENLPQEACVIVGNHVQMHGPIMAELYLPGEHDTWCISQMMHLKEVPDYAYADFWSYKPKAVRWFYRIASYAIAPLSVCVFNNARTIPVYRDNRVIKTFRLTLADLEAGKSVVIFPEHNQPYNHILYDFEDRFIDLARQYGKRTGKDLAFVPLYNAPALKTMYLGEPVYYHPGEDPVSQRSRVKEALMQRITAMAQAAPRHRVYPYLNLPKNQRPYNTTDEEPQSHETTRC